MDKYINLSKYLLDPTLWRFHKGGGHVHFTCHDHYNSTSCNDSSCGNCSGARCCDSCDDEEYPTKYKEPDKLVLIRDQVYGDSFRNLDIKIPDMDKFINSIRNGVDDFGDKYISLEICFPIPKYLENALGEKATNFFNALYELYKSL